MADECNLIATTAAISSPVTAPSVAPTTTTASAALSASLRNRKNRSPDFSADEVSVIVSYHIRHADVLSSKHSNEAMQQRKRQLYNELVRAVNAVGVHERSLQSIKDKWQNLQRDWRSRPQNGVPSSDEERSWSGSLSGPPPLAPPPVAVAIKKEEEDVGVLEELSQFSGVPDLSQELSRLPEISQELQSFPQVSQELQRFPEVSQELPRISEIVQELPRLSEVSQELSRLPNVSHELSRPAAVPDELQRLPEASQQILTAAPAAPPPRRAFLGLASYRRHKLALLRRRTRAAELLAESQRALCDAKRKYFDVLTARAQNSESPICRRCGETKE